MLASLFLRDGKLPKYIYGDFFTMPLYSIQGSPFLSNQDFIECHLPFFNAQLRVIEIRFKALCWIFAREKSCGKGGEGGCFSFFCEHFQCKDHPNEKNMSNKKDEEKQPSQPPTSQWLFVILEAVRSRYKLYFLDAFRPKAGIQRMLNMTCIYCIYIIAQWQLDPSRIRKNERELVYQLQVFPGFK